MNKTKAINRIEESYAYETIGEYLVDRKWLLFWLRYPEVNAISIKEYADSPGAEEGYYLKDISFNIKRWCDFERMCKRLSIQPDDIFCARYKDGRKRSSYDFERIYNTLGLHSFDLAELAVAVEESNSRGWYTRPSNVAAELHWLNEKILSLYPDVAHTPHP